MRSLILLLASAALAGCGQGEGDQVRLTARGDVVADLFEQEQSGDPIG